MNEFILITLGSGLSGFTLAFVIFGIVLGFLLGVPWIEVTAASVGTGIGCSLASSILWVVRRMSQ